MPCQDLAPETLMRPSGPRTVPGSSGRAESYRSPDTGAILMISGSTVAGAVGSAELNTRGAWATTCVCSANPPSLRTMSSATGSGPTVRLGRTAEWNPASSAVSM